MSIETLIDYYLSIMKTHLDQETEQRYRIYVDYFTELLIEETRP